MDKSKLVIITEGIYLKNHMIKFDLNLCHYYYMI